MTAEATERPAIYFACSIKGGRDPEDVARYTAICRHLQLYGTVLTEHLADPNLPQLGEEDDRFIHDRDLTWLLQSAVTVAELSNPSHGVGYELGVLGERLRQATSLHHILGLYRVQEGKKLSCMLRGSPQLQVQDYTTLDEALSHIDTFLANLGYRKN